MKKNKSKKINIQKLIKIAKKNSFAILVGLLIISTIVLIGVNIYFGNSVDIEEKHIANLYEYISNEEITKCEGLLFYSDDKVTKDGLTDGQKTCISFIKTDNLKGETVKLKKDKKSKICSLEDGIKFATDNYEGKKCTIKKYETSLVKAKYKEIFGENMPEDLKSFVIDDANICYLKDNEYYCGLSEIFSFTIGNESFVYRTINQAKEKGNNEVIIYDYFIKINNNKCYPSFNSTKEIKECSKKYNSKDKMNFKFIKKHGTKYKHIFKKLDNSDNYYWFSSEPIN